MIGRRAISRWSGLAIGSTLTEPISQGTPNIPCPQLRRIDAGACSPHASRASREVLSVSLDLAAV
jgi:hypothetical protein